MNTNIQQRDYRVYGESNRRARERGLVEADWYMSPISRQRLKELMKRKDGPAIRDTLLWFGSLIVLGYLACFMYLEYSFTQWQWWLCIPLFFVYGNFLMLGAISRHHESLHGTPFKTLWMNETLFHISSFLALMPARAWRWSHTRHHTDTLVEGSDTEVVMRPPTPIWQYFLIFFFNVKGLWGSLKLLTRRAVGTLDEREKSFIPETEHGKVKWEARIYLILLLAVVAGCFWVGDIWPLLLIGLPTVYGNMLIILVTITQHQGLYENVLDHRLNCRTFHTNPVIQFLYWNMNYHIEHHMFPMVPYHALPALHKEIKQDCPAPSPSLPAALKEVMSSLKKQRKDINYSLERPLPATANPYKYGPYIPMVVNNLGMDIYRD